MVKSLFSNKGYDVMILQVEVCVPNSLIVSITSVRRSRNDPTATLNFLASSALNVLCGCVCEGVCECRLYT